MLDRQVADTQRGVLQRIVNAVAVDNYRCPIPFHVYAGASDDIVNAAAAQAAFPGASMIAGNHFTILDPAALGNRTAETLKCHLIADIVAGRTRTGAVSVPEITGEPDHPASDERAGGAKYVVNTSGVQGLQVGDYNVQQNVTSKDHAERPHRERPTPTPPVPEASSAVAEGELSAERALGSDYLVVDLGLDGRVSVTTWLDGKRVGTEAAAALEWPMGADAQEDLRWYLEDYLLAPFGVWVDKGPQVEARLKGWGESIFAAVFGSGPARDVYVRMRARGVPFELVFRSAARELLWLPWELMRDPARPIPLALELGMSRNLPLLRTAEASPGPDGRLRVLMVISRPAGLGDVQYRVVARPLLERLEAIRGQVDLVVLRPPTLDALVRTLTAAKDAGKPFQIVHFDGHGAAAPPPDQRAEGGPGSGAEGVLAFERLGGGSEMVSASRIAQVLNSAGVSVVVLNACGSGAVGKDVESSVATCLLAGEPLRS